MTVYSRQSRVPLPKPARRAAAPGGGSHAFIRAPGFRVGRHQPLARGSGAAQFKPKVPKLPRVGEKQTQTTGPAPTYNDRLLEITDARVTQLVKGYEAEAAALAAADQKNAEVRRAYEEQNKAHGVKLKEYQKQKKEWDSCQEREVKPAQAKVETEAEASEEKLTGGDKEAFESIWRRSRSGSRRRKPREIWRR